MLATIAIPDSLDTVLLGTMNTTTLVSGARGYAGTALVTELLAAGHQVRVLDVMWFGSYRGSHPWLEVAQHEEQDAGRN